MNRLKLITWARLAVQLIFFLAVNAAIFGFNPIPLPLPIEQPNNTPTTVVGSSFEAIERFLAQGLFPFLTVGLVVIIAVIVGRAFCGWVCPFGFLQDIVTLGAKEWKRVSTPTHRSLRKVKYYILGLILFVVVTLGISKTFAWGTSYAQALGALYPAPWELFNPAATVFVVVPLSIFQNTLPASVEQIGSIDPVFILRILIAAAILILPARIPRIYCRYICPTGALTGALGSRSLMDIKRNPIRCGDCNYCSSICPMQIDIKSRPTLLIADPECTKCMNCVIACPEGALKISFT